MPPATVCRPSTKVGYQSSALGSGYSMITPSFVNVGSAATEMDIDKMLVIEGATGDSQAEIQVMDSDGKWIGHFYWMREMWDGPTYYPAAWCDGSYNPSGVTLKPGEAVYFYTSRSGLSVKSAGQVDGITLQLNSGYTMIGNGTAVELDADKMVINGVTGDSQAEIQVMDGDGKWIGHFYWMREMWDGPTYYPAGWCDGSYNPSGVVLDPGEAAYFYTSRTGLTMTIKALSKNNFYTFACLSPAPCYNVRHGNHQT